MGAICINVPHSKFRRTRPPVIYARTGSCSTGTVTERAGSGRDR